MPDIPRFYTAFAEWLACMIFILPLKKRTGKIQTAFIMTGALLIQGVFLVLCHEFADRSVATGNAEFHQQIRQTDVFPV